MALFKVCRGSEANLPSVLNDGWAYFCTDTGNFYIDHYDADTNLIRSQINADLSNGLRLQNGDFISAEDLPNLYVWKKYDCDPAVATEENFVGYASSKNNNTFPIDQAHTDGNWYEFMGQLVSSGDYIPLPDHAEVGHMIVVKSVDEDGRILEVETIKIESSGAGVDDETLIIDGIVVGNVRSVNGISPDDDGNVQIDIPSQIQVDWNQTDDTAVDYIKNKPADPTVEDAMALVVETGLVEPVATASGEILTDKNGTVITF